MLLCETGPLLDKTTTTTTTTAKLSGPILYSFFTEVAVRMVLQIPVNHNNNGKMSGEKDR